MVHHGFRDFAQGRRLVRDGMYGAGAAFGLLLRRGHAAGAWLLVTTFIRTVVVRALSDLTSGRAPRVLGRAVWLFRGLADGLRWFPLPRKRGGFTITGASAGGHATLAALEAGQVGM